MQSLYVMHKTGKTLFRVRDWNQRTLLFSRKYRVVIRNVTFERVLENKHYSFYALLMPSYQYQRQRKQKRYKTRDTETIMNQSWKNNDQQHETRIKKQKKHDTLCPSTPKHWHKWVTSSPIIYSNNTMIMVSLV